jgi:peptide subunit release factor 1 (eRF1)
VVLTGADEAKAWIEVPFPPLTGAARGEFAGLTNLVAHVERSRVVGVLLVRRGGYAAGVFRGRELVTSKVGSAYVQGTTKAGGWSQQRYARRRANQASAAFADAADAAARVFGGAKVPANNTLEALVLGGDREGTRAVLADARLAHLVVLVTGAWLEVKDPKLRVLAAVPEQFLAVRISLDP